jgi:2-methylcitrate dehydratase PrpD
MDDARPPVTARLACFVAGFPTGACPPEAAQQVKRAALDLLGVTLAGSVEPAGEHGRAYAASQAAPGPSAVIAGRAAEGRDVVAGIAGADYPSLRGVIRSSTQGGGPPGLRLSPALAALANGTAGHALDFDDIGLGAGHVSVAVMPAALAVAELVGATGAGFIEAMVLGYEVAARLTRVAPDAVSGPYEYGFHKPSVYAVFGGTAACARLLGLDADATAAALGIAASSAGGLRVNFGTMTKPLHAGLASRTAVEAALLARSGLSANPAALEGRFGWFDAVCRSEGDLAAVVDGLGAGGPFAVEEGFVFKRFPCCGANHAAIEAVLELVERHDLRPSEVESLDVAIEARYLNEVLVHPWPATPLEGKFSLAYNVAGALADRAVTIDTFTADRLGALAVLRDRIRTIPDPALPRDAAVVAVRTTDGRDLRLDHRGIRGGLDDPLSWADLADKFRSNTARFLKDSAADEVVDRLARLDEQPTLKPITDLLLDAS